MIEDHKYMDEELLDRYKKTVKTKWQKRWILLRMLFGELFFFLGNLSKAVKSIAYYFFTHKKNSLFKDISYHSKPRNQMDIYSPVGAVDKSEKKPVLIFVHGGTWAYGFKLQYILLGKLLSQVGIVTVILNYTLYPNGFIQDMVEDVDKAVEYCYKNISKFGGDPSRIYLMGHSAGGHIITMLTTGKFIKGEHSHMIKGVLACSGVYDIADHFIWETGRGVEHLSAMNKAMKGPSHFHVNSPTRLLTKHHQSNPIPKTPVLLPPLYLLHGDQDKTVPLHEAKKLYKIYRDQYGGKHQHKLIVYPNVGHIDFMFQLMENPPTSNPILKDILLIVNDKLN
ncbi:hypothetical protein DLAC_02163 [Tieghemostelium lacteum]|uniref:BD-FAE-like domain-containing protein n=1 Tax=Tieghemostelium lacteum TaxID=361077 RepID=A0A152A4B7_TIELA|nr:hypothetical protein DLAC_02163 [Tieghemostelium lacteum]|eukprot:KYR01069.1 hypothetical protein DLAC_02163 [Tieghemostelium lacteum]